MFVSFTATMQPPHPVTERTGKAAWAKGSMRIHNVDFDRSQPKKSSAAAEPCEWSGSKGAAVINMPPPHAKRETTTT
jgi:hypothetical protein